MAEPARPGRGDPASPDEKEVWTAPYGDSRVVIIDAETGAIIQKVPVRSRQINRLRFTSDGKSVLVSDAGNGDLIILDARSRKRSSD